MKFTVKQMLYAMVVAALIAAVIGAGANGSPLAYGIGVSVCMVAIHFLFFALLYWGTLTITGGRRQPLQEVQALPNVPPPKPEMPKELSKESE